MKTLRQLLLLTLLLSTLPVQAANPSFGSFDQTYFTTNNRIVSFRSNSIPLLGVTNLYVTNLFVQNTTITSNLFVTNLFVENNAFTSNLFVTNLFATNIFVTNLFAGDTFTTNLFVTNLFVDNSTFTSNLFVTNIFAGDTITTNLFVTNIFVENIFQNGTNVGTINPTDTYVPYRFDTNTFLDSPMHIPSPQVVQFDGGLLKGTNATTIAGYDPSTDAFILALNDESAGESEFWEIWHGSWSTNDWTGYYSYIDAYGSAHAASLYLYAFDDSVSADQYIMGAQVNPNGPNEVMHFRMGKGAYFPLNLDPAAAIVDPAYEFDTLFAHDAATTLFRVGNFQTNQLTVSSTSGYTGTGTNIFTDDGTFKSISALGITNGSALNIASTVFMAVNGDDATAARGRPDLPALTLTNAVALAQDGDVIRIGPGTFPMGTNRVFIGNVSIIGSGQDKTIVTGGGARMLLLTNDVNLLDFTLFSTNELGDFCFPIFTTPYLDPVEADIRMQNFTVKGQSDCVSLNSTNRITFRGDNCTFLSSYDTFLIFNFNTNSLYQFYGCDFTVTRHASLFGSEMRALVLNGGPKIDMLGCSILASNATTDTIGIYNVLSDLTLSGNTFNVTSSAGSVYNLEQDAGSTLTLSCIGDTSQYLINGGTFDYPCDSSGIINPTDDYLPVRSNATTFADSPLYRVGLTNTATDGQLIFGPGTTNVLYRDGNNLVYTNGGTSAYIQVTKGDGTLGRLQMTTGSHLLLLGGTGSDLYFGVNNNGGGDYIMLSSAFIPVTGGAADLGSINNPWNDVYVDGNVTAELSVGDTTFVDMKRGSQTNQVSGALTFAHATNGVHGLDSTHVRWMFNSSGSDQTLTIPATWRTNVFSAVPPAITNSTITVMYLKCGGPTDTAASQTNCYVSFEFYK